MQTSSSSERHEKKSKRKMNVVFAPRYTLRRPKIARMLSWSSWESSCMRWAHRLVGAGNRDGVVDLLAGSGAEVLLLLFPWHLGHEWAALVLFWHRRGRRARSLSARGFH